ncbi:MAG: hypothetical protein Q9227_005038 [Pyrenula ochraceoflavens]
MTTDIPSATTIKIHTRRKAFHSKVKTGCGTCKWVLVRASSIHFDLANLVFKIAKDKIYCRRCTKTGRPCDGYEDQHTPHHERALPLVSTLRPGAHCFEFREDAQAFQYYATIVTTRLQSAYASEMWDVFIPQASYQYSAVKEAILAVGNRQLAGDAHPEWSARLELISLQHYGKALRHLANVMPPLDVILLTCLLFMAYEHLGSWRKVTHARYGIKLVQDYRSKTMANVDILSSDLLQKELIPIFEGFVAQSLQYYFSLSYPELETDTSSRPAPSVPDCLHSSFDAYVALYGVMIFALEKLASYESLSESDAASGSAEDIYLIDNIISKWSASFTEFCENIAATNELEKNVRRLLWTNFRVLYMVTQATLANDEMAFDKYTEGFESILSNCAKALAAKHPSTETTLGLVPPIFFVATRCRDPIIRRKALAQLKAPHCSERMRNTCQAANIAERIMYLEERGISSIKSAADISRSRRIKLLNGFYDPNGENIIAKVVQGSNEGHARSMYSIHVPFPSCDELLCSRYSDGRHVMRKETILMKIIGGYVAESEECVKDSLEDMDMHDPDADGEYELEYPPTC